MRRLVVTQNITVDGVIDGEGGWFDPTADTAQGRELAEMTREHAAASDGFLVGRVTFEEMRGFWPQRTDDETGVTDHLQRVEKHVVSRTLDDPGWEGTEVLRGGDGLADEVLALKERDGRDIVVTGSIALVHDLLRLGLVDELRLIQHPVALGTGRRLVPDGVDLRLALAETRAFSEGAVLLRYLVEPVAGA